MVSSMIQMKLVRVTKKAGIKNFFMEKKLFLKTETMFSRINKSEKNLSHVVFFLY